MVKPLALVVLLSAFVWLSMAVAQGQQTAPTPPSSTQPGQKPEQNTTPEAGGPQGDIGPIAIPKKKDDQPKKDDTPRPPKKVEGLPEFSIKVNVPVVTLDVSVVTAKEGIFVPNLKKEHFKVLEDGVPQEITNFGQSQAPITAVMLVEFANTFADFQRDSIIASYTFTQTLKKEDWVALISYDIRPHILTDFTQNKNEIIGGLRTLTIAMSAETNLFDSLYDTIDRLEQLEGRKYIILVASGRDTFSRRTYDQLLKRLQATKDIVIYAVGTGQTLRQYAESHGLMRALCGITSFSCGTEFLQFDNQMKTFAKLTGGKAYFPLFQAQFREIFADVGDKVRNQYSISYHPSNRNQDGSLRKIKVELIDDKGGPLRMLDEKRKDVKYQLVYREAYKAKPQVE
ncbi:MAG TPA: VWA domain-containing protein [Candidatus Saccharimonadales bacterium]|nr:VWA domain-containing protein [Candidatus Saccharimonadales bacterium]